MDATKLYGCSKIQPSPYDEIKMWHGHPDLCMKWIDKVLNTPDDSDIGYLVDVNLKYTDNIKEKQRISHLELKTELFGKINIMII